MRREQLFGSLHIKPIDLIGSWWHAGDVETALDELRHALDEHDLGEALPEARIRADHDRASDAQSNTEHDLEAAQRDHQIGVTAVAANELLAKRGDARRFRCFDRKLASESEEPAWLLVTPEEHATLRANTGALDPLDAIYDEVRSVAELPAIVWPAGSIPLQQLSPAEAGIRAYKAFWDQRYAEALQLYPSAVTDVRNGYVAEIGWIETLLRVGDREAAAARWRITADRWDSARFVWDRQWEQLAELYTELGLDEPERFARVQSKRPPPPAVRKREEVGAGVFDVAVPLTVGAMWLVETSSKVVRGDRLVIGEDEIAITEDATEGVANGRGQIGIRILDEREPPSRGTVVRFVRG